MLNGRQMEELPREGPEKINECKASMAAYAPRVLPNPLRSTCRWAK